MNYKAVIFDMDGVIFDSERIFFDCYKEAVDEFDTGLGYDDYDLFLGRSRANAIDSLSEVIGDRKKAIHIYDLHEEFAFDFFYNEPIPQKGNMKKVFQDLKNMGYKLGLATSTTKKDASFFLEKEGLLQYFDGQIYGDEVIHSKPHPEIYEQAAERLGEKKADCLVIEDSINGIRSAYDAGMDVIMIPDMLKPDQEAREKTLAVLDHVEDLIDYLA